jgi:uncharacterized caspase-like protein/ribosomal protein L21E
MVVRVVVLMLSFMLMSLFGIDDSRALKIKLEKMQKEQRVALIIGNSKYSSKSFSQLKNPINDARLMKQILEQRKFKVYYLENASKREFKKTIKKFANDLKRGGVGLFYFAGHGLQVNGFNYLIPTDSEIEDKSDVEFEAIALNYITTKMKDARNRLNIVILDACRNDPFSRSAGGGLAPVSNAKGMFIAYATEAGSVASDGGDGKNGMFTKYLAQYIIKPLPIEDVFKNTRKDVYNQTDGKQSPGVYNQILGDFYFTIPTIIKKDTVAVVQSVQSVSVATDVNLNADKEMWDLIKNTKSVADVEYFLQTYPNSKFAPVAKLKLQQLKREQKTTTIVKNVVTPALNEVRTTNTLFLDNFTDNRNNWSTNKANGDTELTISNDRYTFSHLRDKGGWSVWKSVDIDENRDFKIEIAMKHISGVNNYAFGFLWGGDDKAKYSFSISANGYFLYGNYDKNGKWHTITKWEKSSYINKYSQRNILAIEKRGNYIDLIANGHVMKTVSYEKFYGNNLGLSVDNKQAVEFDYIKVTQSPKPKKTYTTNDTGSYIKSFYDGFIDNRKDWSIQNDAKVELAIRDGYYVFSHKRNSGSWLTWNKAKIDQNKDFEITTAAKHVYGVKTYSYGIMWGENADDSYFFGVSDNGQYLYGKYVNGKWKTLAGWTKSSYINKGNQRNVISVRKKGNKLELRINFVTVKTLDYERFKGNNIGLSVDNNQRIDFDYLKVKVTEPVAEVDFSEFTQNANSYKSTTKFYDGFIDNRNDWAIANDYKKELAIRDGYHVFSHKRDTGAWLTWEDVKLSPYEDFEIKTSMKHVSGVDTYAYGLMWGKDSQDSYLFGISANGQYLYGKYVNGKWKTLAGWTKSSDINKGNARNTLAIKKEGDKLHLIINSKTVKTVPFERFSGTNVGFSITRTQRVDFDYLKVSKLTKNSLSSFNSNSDYISSYYDGFVDNRKNWSTENDSKVHLYIQDGYYMFQHKRGSKSWISWNKAKINQNRNFEIVSAVKHVSGVDNYSYGIMWGEDAQNSYFFGISANGQYLYGKYVNGKWKTLAGWVKSNYINKYSARNVIGIRKKGNNIELRINFVTVKTLSYERFSGSNIGFSVDNNQKVGFDYIKVKMLD